jgi:hypothetical protein
MAWAAESRLVTAWTISLLASAPLALYPSRRIRATRLTCGKSMFPASATQVERRMIRPWLSSSSV